LSGEGSEQTRDRDGSRSVARTGQTSEDAGENKSNMLLVVDTPLSIPIEDNDDVKDDNDDENAPPREGCHNARGRIRLRHLRRGSLREPHFGRTGPQKPIPLVFVAMRQM
jgi:hypothetical protein